MSQLLEELIQSGELDPEGVIHLGAEWCQEAPLYGPNRNVLWIEASSDNIPVARKQLEAFPRQRLLHMAVWHEDGLDLQFNIYNARSSNSLFGNEKMQTWYPRHHVEATETVKTITVDTALDKYFTARYIIEQPHKQWINAKGYIVHLQAKPSLLVMDLQGAELHALQGAIAFLKGNHLTHICTEAVTEPLYRGGCLLEELDVFLAPFGFKQLRKQRHEVSIWYPEIQRKIDAGELPPIPQFDVLYGR